jgi:hypothetical protein
MSLTLVTNIRLGWKQKAVANTIAYYKTTTIMAVKKFYSTGPRIVNHYSCHFPLSWGYTIKHFTAVMEQHALKNVNNCWNTNIYSYLETSGGQKYKLYLNIVHFLIPVLIRHSWHLKTVVFLHWCLMSAALLLLYRNKPECLPLPFTSNLG